MKKLKQIILLIIALLPCLFVMGGCSLFDQKVYVTDIKHSGTVGTSTIYTIYYSDGTHSLLSVENGKNGQNGQDLTLESIKQYCENNGINFESFLKEYLTVVQKQQSVQDAANISALSSVSMVSAGISSLPF